MGVKHPVLVESPATAPATEPEPLLPDTPFPPDLRFGEPHELDIDGDRSLRVTHAAGENVHAIVYLHGMCGNSKGADPWAHLAANYGSLVVVRANVPCGDRPGYKWPKDLELIQARIDAALSRVKDVRGGWLDVDHPSLIGYSQGAYRAEQLAAAFPGHYQRAILGGPPTPPSYEALKGLEAIAILGGELEDSSHMQEGTRDLLEHGARARFFMLPRVHHGSYGPEGPRVVADALAFVFSVSPD